MIARDLQRHPLRMGKVILWRGVLASAPFPCGLLTILWMGFSRLAGKRLPFFQMFRTRSTDASAGFLGMFCAIGFRGKALLNFSLRVVQS